MCEAGRSIQNFDAATLAMFEEATAAALRRDIDTTSREPLGSAEIGWVVADHAFMDLHAALASNAAAAL